MTREVDVTIVFCEVFNDNAIEIIKEETGLALEIREITSLITSASICLRGPLDEDIERIKRAFMATCFINPRMATLYLYADDGSIELAAPRCQL